MADVQQVNPSATVQTGDFSVVGGSAHAVLADGSDATYVQFASGGPNLNVTGVHTLPDADHRRHRIRLTQRSNSTLGEAGFESVAWRMRQPDGSNPISFSANPDVAYGDFVSAWFFPESNPFPDFANANPLTVSMLGRPQFVSAGCRTAKVFIEIDSRHKPTFDSEIQDRAGVDRSGGIVTDTNQPRVVWDNYDLDDLPVAWALMQVYAGPGPHGAGDVPVQTVNPVGALLADPFILDPLPDGVYTMYGTTATIIKGGSQFPSVLHTVTFEVAFDPPQAPGVTATVDGCSEIDGPNVEVCWEVAEPGSGEEFFDSIHVVDIRRTDCNGTRLIHSETVP